MKLVQGIFYICVKYEFEFSAIHVPGAKNKIDDSLSRGQIKLFRSLAPNADDTMTLMVDYKSECVSPL